MRTNTSTLGYSIVVALALSLAACGFAPADESSTQQDIQRYWDDPCIVLSPYGECEGTVLKWCSAWKRLHEVDCAYEPDTTCGYVDGHGATCVKRGEVGTECRSYRDCKADLECPESNDSPWTCKCLQGVCKDRYPDPPAGEPNDEG